MAQYGKRLDKSRQVDLRYSFEANSDEAWAQIKAFVQSPAKWFFILFVVSLLMGVFCLARFLYSVRAPELAAEHPTAAAATERSPEGGHSAEEIDDSNIDQPLLSGARKDKFYTFLLFGTDKEGTNTDTIMVMSYDVANQKLNLMSIPRDTMVNVGWDIKKINSVYGVRGLDGFKKQVSKLIGFSPDYYVKIDLQAFVDVVDLIGGVDFDVPIPMHYHDPYQDLSIDLDPGLQTLNGEQAMGLVRFRKSDRGASGSVTGYDDTGRVQTQQAFLQEMFKKCVKLSNWTKIRSYVEIFEKNVESDLTLGNMLWFAKQAMGLGEGDFQTVTAPGNTGARAYSRSTNTMQSYVTLYGSEMVKLINERFNPYLMNVTMANLDIMGVNSDGSVYSSTGYVADSAAALPVAQKTDDRKGGTEDHATDAQEEPEEPPEDEMPEDAEAPFDPTEEPTDGETGEPENGETPPEGESGAEDAPEPEPEPETQEPTTTDTTPTESGDQ